MDRKGNLLRIWFESVNKMHEPVAFCYKVTQILVSNPLTTLTMN